MTDEERLRECRREIMRLRAIVRDYGRQLDCVIEYAKSELDENKPYLYGEEERSNDLYDCGYVDGEYNALIEVLNRIGEEHDYEFQGG